MCIYTMYLRYKNVKSEDRRLLPIPISPVLVDTKISFRGADEIRGRRFHGLAAIPTSRYGRDRAPICGGLLL